MTFHTSQCSSTTKLTSPGGVPDSAGRSRLGLGAAGFWAVGLLSVGGVATVASLLMAWGWAGMLLTVLLATGAYLAQDLRKGVRHRVAFLNNSPFAVVVVGEAANIESANARAAEWLGSLRGLSGTLREVVGSLFSCTEAVEFTYRVDGSDAEHRWLRASFLRCAPSILQRKQCAVLSLVDVTAERTFALQTSGLRAALALSESRSQRIAECAADAVITCGPDGVLRWWSPGSNQLFGYSDADGLSRHFTSFASEFELANPDGSPVALQDWPVPRMLRGEESLDTEFLVRRLDDGSIRRLRYRCSSIRDTQGAVVELVLAICDLKRLAAVEAEQQQATALLHAVADQVGSAAFAVDLAGRVSFANAAAKDLLRLTAGDAVPATSEGGVHSEAMSGVLAKVGTAAPTGRSDFVTAELDGVHWAFAVSPILNERGTVLGAFAIAHRQSASNPSAGTRHWLDQVSVPTFACRGEFVSYANPALLDLLNCGSRKDLDGKRSHELFVREQQNTVAAWFRAMAPEAESAGEFRLQRTDGTELECRVASFPFVGLEGASRIISVANAGAFPTSTTAVQALIGCMQDAVLASDRSGAITWASDAGSAMFGYGPGELIGQRISSLMPEALRYVFRARFAEHASGREVLPDPCVRHELVAQRKDGTYFPVSVSVASCLIQGVRTFTAVIRDLSAFKQLEAKFLQAQKMEAIGRLTGGVVHDFNNLLMVINGHCELLRGQGVPDEIASGLGTIQDAGRRAASLTRYLLAFSRKAAADLKVVDVNEVIRVSRPLMTRLIGEDIRLALDLHPEAMPILIDPSQFDQVIMNLVVNARDAMQSGGTLTIETRVFDGAESDLGRAVQIAIRDTGCGMTEAVQKRLFEPFFTTKSSGKGTGLGLSVVHKVVTEHHGSVRVSSALGKGTTFYLTFPLLGTEPVEEHPVEKHAVPRGSGTVLLVEDDTAVRTVARTLLTANGYTVIEAANGFEAMAAATKAGRTIDLLLTDVVMPDMSGTVLVQTLRELNPEIRSIYMSGYMDDKLGMHGLRREDGIFIEKPFTQQQLLQAVHDGLNGKD